MTEVNLSESSLNFEKPSLQEVLCNLHSILHIPYILPLLFNRALRSFWALYTHHIYCSRSSSKSYTHVIELRNEEITIASKLLSRIQRRCKANLR